MRHSDETKIGGSSGEVPTTRWSALRAARTRDEARRNRALTGLCHAYWKPVYFFFRRHGYKNETAKDLTQDFFFEYFIQGRLPKAADRELGCFRHLLATALNRFMLNRERNRRRKKRAPAGGLVSLTAPELGTLELPSSEATPDEAYLYAFITDLLDYALAQTEKECRAGGLQMHWDVFRRKVLAPIRQEAPDIPMKDICRQYGVKDESTAYNMTVTVKRRYREVLMKRLRDLARSEADAQADFQEICRFLSEHGAKL
ncbi:MAG: hypothetical protein MUC88_24595 [Planctomycetes bacterium]|jgi:hypothetical protein|nr:hypothetical protein [Planctomycetota bacterium]